MNNIIHIKNFYNSLYEKLIKYDCKVSYNGTLLYEGKYNENYNYGNNINKSCVVLEFNISGKRFICLEEENGYIEKLKDISDINEVLSNPKLYNKYINLAHNLPLYNICEDSVILKKGISVQKLYENLKV